MTWPSLSDYSDAIQNPRHCFQDTQLKTGKVALTNLSLPRVASGNFASVYEVRTGNQRWAVRCFQRQVPAQQARYGLLSQHLRQSRLPSLVGFDYIQDGIRVHGKFYPILKMDWIEGITLSEYVDNCWQRSGHLLQLALQWCDLISGLHQNQIAHGDLQHGNVLVTSQGLMRLVDYDGMFVPSLAGQLSFELGHPNFQHPKRTSTDFNEGLDSFSALVIYTSLRALAADPALWRQFYKGENLILSSRDYKTPKQSEVLRRLKQNSDDGVKQLAIQIEQWCSISPTQVPNFDTVIASLPAIKHTAGTTAPTGHPSWIPSPTSKSANAQRKTEQWWTRVLNSTSNQRTTTNSPFSVRDILQSHFQKLLASISLWHPLLLTAIACAFLALIPVLHLLAGLAAVICSIVSWRSALLITSPEKRVAGLAFFLGAAFVVIPLIPSSFLESGGGLPDDLTVARRPTPPPTTPQGAAPPTPTPELGARPPRPSKLFKDFQADDGSFALQVPVNWDILPGGGGNHIFAPKDAHRKFPNTDNGSLIITHGIFVGVLSVKQGDLQSATQAFIQRQIETNAGFQSVGQMKQTLMAGQQGLAAAVAGSSAINGVMEIDVTYTTVTADGRLFYIITISPEDEADAYKSTFQQILSSLRLANK